MTPAATGHHPGGKVRRAWPVDSKIYAVFSECGTYRYQLCEVWDEAKPLVLWVLMNPSIATEAYSDPTLDKTGHLSKSWGYGGQLVGNVHAYRATDSRRLLAVVDPVGPKNDQMILDMAAQAKTVVLAYGQAPGGLRQRGRDVETLLSLHPSLCHLKLAKNGTPMHPLYLPPTLTPQPHRVVA